MERIVEITADGSATIYLPDLDEHYHSVKGALTESRHIYLDTGLRHKAGIDTQSRPFNVLEVGLGTGLNAAVTAMSGIPVTYHAYELYPLSIGEVSSLNYPTVVDGALLERIHAAEWGRPTIISPTFTIEKVNADIASASLPGGIDVVYFDAFAPDKQPELWETGVLERIYDILNPGGVLTTYCAKGIIRRRLEAIGFTVERLPGPPGGKREILRGTKAGG